MRAGGWLAAALLLPAACSVFSTDDSGSGVDTGSPDVVLRGISKTEVVNQKEIAAPPPAEGKPGDLLWAVVATTSAPSVTAPAGFEAVNTDYGYACGPWGSTLSVYTHAIGESEPASYTWTFPNIANAALSLVAIGGTQTGSVAVETSALTKVGSGPFTPPKLTASDRAYALLTYAVIPVGNAPDVTWELPEGTNRLFDANGTLVVGRPAEQKTVVDVAPIKPTPNDACGYVHAAILRRR